MKEQLIAIYQALTTVSTKGQDTLIMADCLRAFGEIIQAMPEDKEEKEGE